MTCASFLLSGLSQASIGSTGFRVQGCSWRFHVSLSVSVRIRESFVFVREHGDANGGI